MSVPGNMLDFSKLPPIPRELPPEVQAQLLAMRMGVPYTPGGAAPGATGAPATPPGFVGPTIEQGGLTMEDLIAAAMQPPQATPPPVPVAAAPAAAATPPPGNVPYRTGMAPQQAPQAPPTPLGAVLNPAANIPVDPFQGPPEPEREPPTVEGQPVGPAQTQGPAASQGRFHRWKDFIQRFKTDPNVRMAVTQSIIALTQPAGNAAESIGNSLNVGAKTLDTLRSRDFDQTRQVAADKQTERRTQTMEQEVGLRGSAQDIDQKQFKDQMDFKLKELEQNGDYQKQLLEVRRLEALGEAGQQGQVNQRWTQLTDALLAQPDADLLKFAEGPERKNRARLRAFDAISSAGQTRQKFIADQIATQQIFLPDPTKDPEKYRTELAALIGRVGSYADAAGLFDERVAPAGQPNNAAPTGAASLPQGVTEENVQEAMKVLGLTREQVLTRYKSAAPR